MISVFSVNDMICNFFIASLYIDCLCGKGCVKHNFVRLLRNFRFCEIKQRPAVTVSLRIRQHEQPADFIFAERHRSGGISAFIFEQIHDAVRDVGTDCFRPVMLREKIHRAGRVIMRIHRTDGLLCVRNTVSRSSGFAFLIIICSHVLLVLFVSGCVPVPLRQRSAHRPHGASGRCRIPAAAFSSANG